jgi:antitoxin (DNA-binding transcriptional repressor) of toxin-antitoxin stability system
MNLSLAEVQARLPDLIHSLTPGDELVITENERPVARLTTAVSESKPLSRPGPGVCRGAITYMAEDFDAPMEELKEYME